MAVMFNLFLLFLFNDCFVVTRGTSVWNSVWNFYSPVMCGFIVSHVSVISNHIGPDECTALLGTLMTSLHKLE